MFSDNHVIGIAFGIVQGEPYNKSHKITHVYQFLKFSSLETLYLSSTPFKKEGEELFYYIWMAHICEVPVFTPTR
jgi:hypothetical protein